MRSRRFLAAVLALGALISASGPATAGPAPSVRSVAEAGREVQDRSLEAAGRHDIPGAVPVRTVPLDAGHCRDYPEVIASSPEMSEACRLGQFGSAERRSHCVASAGLFTTDLIFGFYVASMGFFVNCLNQEAVLACFGVIAGVGVPPGGYGPGLPKGSGCFGSTTPWVSRRTQSYTAVVGVSTLFGGLEIGFFPLSY